MLYMLSTEDATGSRGSQQEGSAYSKAVVRQRQDLAEFSRPQICGGRPHPLHRLPSEHPHTCPLIGSIPTEASTERPRFDPKCRIFRNWMDGH